MSNIVIDEQGVNLVITEDKGILAVVLSGVVFLVVIADAKLEVSNKAALQA